MCSASQQKPALGQPVAQAVTLTTYGLIACRMLLGITCAMTCVCCLQTTQQSLDRFRNGSPIASVTTAALGWQTSWKPIYDPDATEPVLSDEDIHVSFNRIYPTTPGLPKYVLAAMHILGQNSSIIRAGQLQELAIAADAAQLLQGSFLWLSLSGACMLSLMILSLHAYSVALQPQKDSFHAFSTNQIDHVASMPVHLCLQQQKEVRSHRMGVMLLAVYNTTCGVYCNVLVTLGCKCSSLTTVTSLTISDLTLR